MAENPPTPKKRRWPRRLAIAAVLFAVVCAIDRLQHPVFWGPKYFLRIPAPFKMPTQEETIQRLRDEKGIHITRVTGTNSTGRDGYVFTAENGHASHTELAHAFAAVVVSNHLVFFRMRILIQTSGIASCVVRST